MKENNLFVDHDWVIWCLISHLNYTFGFESMLIMIIGNINSYDSVNCCHKKLDIPSVAFLGITLFSTIHLEYSDIITIFDNHFFIKTKLLIIKIRVHSS